MNNRQKRIAEQMEKVMAALVLYGYKFVDKTNFSNTAYYVRGDIHIVKNRKRMAVYSKRAPRRIELPLDIPSAIELVQLYEDNI